MFQTQILNINGNNWSIVRVEIDNTSRIVTRAIEQARVKSRHTRDEGQDSRPRSRQQKFNNELHGTLAESYCKEYVMSKFEERGITDYEVMRWDDVRTDGFASPEGNYGIKIQKRSDISQEYFLESPSSLTNNYNLQQAVGRFDIIGPYYTAIRRIDTYADFYFRPLYDNYTIPLTRNFEDDINNNRVNLYFVGGCTGTKIETDGYTGSLWQGGSDYRLLKITDGSDMINFFDEMLAVI